MAVLLQTLSARLDIVTGRDLAQACAPTIRPTRRDRPLGAGGGDRRVRSGRCWVRSGSISSSASPRVRRPGDRSGHALLSRDSAATVSGRSRRTSSRSSPRSASAFRSNPRQTRLARRDWRVRAAHQRPKSLRRRRHPRRDRHAHNLYLHSALVQTRAIDDTTKGQRITCRYNLVDQYVA